MVGTGVVARYRILIKDAETLAIAHRIGVVAFDRSDALTIGQPTLLAALPQHPRPRKSTAGAGRRRVT